MRVLIINAFFRRRVETYAASAISNHIDERTKPLSFAWMTDGGNGRKGHVRIEEPCVCAVREAIEVRVNSIVLILWTRKLGIFPCQLQYFARDRRTRNPELRRKTYVVAETPAREGYCGLRDPPSPAYRGDAVQ
jgi:hypothetical protein